MEPKSPEHRPMPIEMPSVPTMPEGLPSYSPEKNNEQRVEQAPAKQEANSTQSTPVVQLPTPVTIPDPISDGAQATATTDDNPAVAADEDLIEKEWVDKAKKVIADTKNDPHQQERQVGKLQADYLKKRYGKELGSSE